MPVQRIQSLNQREHGSPKSSFPAPLPPPGPQAGTAGPLPCSQVSEQLRLPVSLWYQKVPTVSLGAAPRLPQRAVPSWGHSLYHPTPCFSPLPSSPLQTLFAPSKTCQISLPGTLDQHFWVLGCTRVGGVGLQVVRLRGPVCGIWLHPEWWGLPAAAKD